MGGGECWTRFLTQRAQRYCRSTPNRCITEQQQTRFKTDLKTSMYVHTFNQGGNVRTIKGLWLMVVVVGPNVISFHPAAPLRLTAGHRRSSKQQERVRKRRTLSRKRTKDWSTRNEDRRRAARSYSSRHSSGHPLSFLHSSYEVICRLRSAHLPSNCRMRRHYCRTTARPLEGYSCSNLSKNCSLRCWW